MLSGSTSTQLSMRTVLCHVAYLPCPFQNVLVLQLVRIFTDVLTAWKSITLLDVFECEETFVSLAHVVCPEVN